MALPFVVGLAVSAETRKAAMKGDKELAKMAMKKIGKGAKIVNRKPKKAGKIALKATGKGLKKAATSTSGKAIIGATALQDIDEIYKEVEKIGKEPTRSRYKKYSSRRTR